MAAPARPSCLGSGEYAARIIRRRTAGSRARPLGELPTLESGSWARTPQATTDASVVVALQADGCVDVLNRTLPWRDELELYRQNGMSDDLVWAGPVQDVVANPGDGTATLTAKDSSAWFAKRLASMTDRTWTAVDLAVVFEDLITAAFALDDPGISIAAVASGIVGDWIIAASDLRRLDNELGELARIGVDWTTTGRRFWIGASAGRLQTRLTDEAFRVPPQTRRTGAGMVNDAWVRGNGTQGHYGGPDDDGVLLQDVRDEQSVSDPVVANASARTWWDRGHEPAVYLEGDNQLEPDAPVDVQTLIPGIIAPVDVTGGGVVPYAGDLRLEGLSVAWSPEGEDVTVTLQPLGTVITDG